MDQKPTIETAETINSQIENPKNHKPPNFETLNLQARRTRRGVIQPPSSASCVTFLCHQESSVLQSNLLEHANLVRYVQQCKTEFIDASPTPTYSWQSHTAGSSSTSSRSTSSSKTKTKSKPKRDKTEEEKTFKIRSKYFVAAQLVAVVVFITIMTSFDDAEVDLDE
ncbi:hypothetical protein PIB30_078654 [Stylosanthes scabra]|uniref:Uncharacterized protein n=1 Tax=Stylosanthes scabra TaxID=79078 RepID=A0ABU6RQR5_9FABA|nr:hypothetical protein [Stylosanthes scabra]